MREAVDNNIKIREFSNEILNMLGFGVVIIEAESHKVVYANAKFSEMSGHDSRKSIGVMCHQYLCPADVGSCPITDLGQAVDNSERKMVCSDSSQLAIIKTVVPITFDGRKYLIESVVDHSEQVRMRQELAESNNKLKIEIMKREEMQKRMTHLAYHDYLTDLPNRLLLQEQLEHAINLATRSSKMLAIMFLDLDGFKLINDTVGHDVGDKLLIEVAKRLKNILRRSDVVARIGGDEFVILIESLDDLEAIKTVADKIRDSFINSFKIDNKEYYVTTSIGVSIYPTDGESTDSLIKNADIAMATAKKKGRNQWYMCNPAMKDDVVETMRLNNQLFRALERNELLLYYQPQVNSQTGRIIGLEALIRWQHPELGMVPPGKFIPIAEQTGLIHNIGEWVIRNACRQNKAWQDQGIAKIPVAVNLSIMQFNNSCLVDKVEGVLRETGLLPQFLELEITEGVIMQEIKQVISTLQAFKDRGITISIDDFGTEYSSLNYLKQLPIDKIKIAMPFVQGIGVSETDQAITKAILLLGKSMGLRVIAEGVETENQLSFLVNNVCDEIQGFYYYKPMPVDEVTGLLKKQSTLLLK